MTTTVRLAVATIQRKMTRSLAQRGALRTIQRCLVTPWNMLLTVLRYWLPSEQQFLIWEREFDKRHNVRTCQQWDPAWVAQIASPNWKHGIGYEPVPVVDAAKILAGLNIRHEEFVFVDIGAGKGRAVLMAAEYPFKRIVGVEYSSALTDVLKANISSYRNPNQKCFELEGLHQDATTYAIPLDKVVMFFHHPFESVVFQQILARIEQSLAHHPRKMLAIYYDPHCEVVFRNSPCFRLVKRGSASGHSTICDEWVIYESVF
jgi:SAM-dependent methyltransferase